MVTTASKKKGVLTVTVRETSTVREFVTPLSASEREQLDALVNGGFAFDKETSEQIGIESIGIIAETRYIEVVKPFHGG